MAEITLDDKVYGIKEWSIDMNIKEETDNLLHSAVEHGFNMALDRVKEIENVIKIRELKDSVDYVLGLTTREFFLWLTKHRVAFTTHIVENKVESVVMNYETVGTKAPPENEHKYIITGYSIPSNRQVYLRCIVGHDHESAVWTANSLDATKFNTSDEAVDYVHEYKKSKTWLYDTCTKIERILVYREDKPVKLASIPNKKYVLVIKNKNKTERQYLHKIDNNNYYSYVWHKAQAKIYENKELALQEIELFKNKMIANFNSTIFDWPELEEIND